MKYIVFENSDGDRNPVIFPRLINHDSMARLCEGLGKPVSAGFIQEVNENGTIEANGRSISLNLSALPDDTKLIYKFLRQRL